MPDFSMPNAEQVNLATESFRMLADATRVKLLGVWRVTTFFVGHEAHRNVLASSQVELNP